MESRSDPDGTSGFPAGWLHATLDRQQAQFDPGTEVEAATAKLVSLGQRGVKVGIWFAIVWLPVLAGLGIALVVAYLLARWFRRRTAGELPSSAVSGGGA